VGGEDCNKEEEKDILKNNERNDRGRRKKSKIRILK
jgi:hypothetical protein